MLSDVLISVPTAVNDNVDGGDDADDIDNRSRQHYILKTI